MILLLKNDSKNIFQSHKKMTSLYEDITSMLPSSSYSSTSNTPLPSHPYSDCMLTIIASDLIKLNLPSYEKQRAVNTAWVKQMVREQVGKPILVTGCIALIYQNSSYYITDGQHRFNMLKELYHTRARDLDTLKIYVIVHVCETDVEAERIYKQYINVNTSNERVDSKGEFRPQKECDIAIAVAEHFKRKYPNHVAVSSTIKKVYKPMFNPSNLISQLIESGVCKGHLTVDQIILQIEDANTIHGISLKKTDAKFYSKCTAKDGFFLADKGSGCRWVKTIFDK